MFSTHAKAVHDLRNNYPEIASIIKNRNNVIITNNGKSEAVLIPYKEFINIELNVQHIKTNENTPLKMHNAKIMGCCFIPSLYHIHHIFPRRSIKLRFLCFISRAAKHGICRIFTFFNSGLVKCINIQKLTCIGGCNFKEIQ